ncbi:Sperm-Leucylaminopeptidase 7 [Carabus blaptoides fortunei]
MALFYPARVNKLLNVTKTILYSRSCCAATEKKGLVLGVFSKDGKGDVILTSASEHYNQRMGGKLLDAIKLAGNKVKSGNSYLFWGLDSTYRSIAVVGLGDQCLAYNTLEEIDEKKEAIRIAANVGYKNLKQVGMTHIELDDMSDAESAAEGATLASWKFNEYKTKKEDTVEPKVTLYTESQEQCNWNRGLIKAASQNLARRLMETPANKMTPTIFANTAKEHLSKHGVQVEIRDQSWAESMKMGGFLSVTRGTLEPPKFLEMHYTGSKDGSKPIVLVGKGVTFDSGGISLKPSLNMDAMRADMGGAACVVATLNAVAALKLSVNVVGLVPLCENMPSGTATKPGDVITTMNGKTVCVDNTDAEGRLILADALTYSKQFNPRLVLDIATLTGAMSVALGNSATGVFTNSCELWEQLRKAGGVTGDRVWRFPLWKHYTNLVTGYDAYDVNNVGKGKGGGSCTAAAFLREFVPENVDWLHLDMASVMGPTDEIKYIGKGMTGRPTRTLIQFLEQLST